MLIIPAIDLKNGQCVRLRQGDFADVDVFSDDPVTMAGRWIEQGCERLHLVDLDGARDGLPTNQAVIAEIAKTYPNVPIQVGGGIRSLRAIETYLDLGVSYTILGTKAIESPDFLAAATQKFPGKIILGLDAREGKLATKGWEEQSTISAVEFGQSFTDHNLAAIIYTDIAKDGMMGGVNIEATAELARETGIPVIASGGIHTLDDVGALMPHHDAGIVGVITGRAIYEGTLDLAEAISLAKTENNG